VRISSFTSVTGSATMRNRGFGYSRIFSIAIAFAVYNQM
jgi:hypothetical protein